MPHTKMINTKQQKVYYFTNTNMEEEKKNTHSGVKGQFSDSLNEILQEIFHKSV